MFKVKLIALVVVTLLTASPVNAKHLLVFGDSLSAAYNLPVEQGWVNLLAEYWHDAGGSEGQKKAKVQHIITNASISGETTVGGLLRLPITLEQIRPDIVLLALGANDALRGLPVKQIQANLAQMIEQINAAGAQVILGAISLPISYGPRYIDQFREMYANAAEQHDIPLVDLYLEEVAYNPDLLMQDGLHPNLAAQTIIFNNLLEQLQRTALFD